MLSYSFKWLAGFLHNNNNNNKINKYMILLEANNASRIMFHLKILTFPPLTQACQPQCRGRYLGSADLLFPKPLQRGDQDITRIFDLMARHKKEKGNHTGLLPPMGVPLQSLHVCVRGCVCAWMRARMYDQPEHKRSTA